MSLLNLNSIAGGDISGLKLDEIEFLKFFGGKGRLVDQWTGLPVPGVGCSYALDPELDALLEDLADLGAEPDADAAYRELTSVEVDGIQEVENSARTPSTDAKTKQHVALLKSFLRSNGLPDNIEKMPVRYLAQYLRVWFVSLKRRNGDVYSVNSLVGFRASIHRYLKRERDIDVIGNSAFNHFERTYKAMLTASVKAERVLGQDTGFRQIEDSDLKKLSTYFDRSDPTKLQDEVFFSIAWHFGFRGREWIRELKPGAFIFQTDGSQECVTLKMTGKEKTTSADNPTTNKQIKMYATSDEARCPVSAVRLYLSLLSSDCKALFPRPLAKFSPGKWYSSTMVLGKNTLNDMMSAISVRAGLSAKYTNHCIRPTVVTSLVEKGVSVQDIQAVTGHKRVESVQRYTKRISSAKKQKLSNFLSESLHSGNVSVELNDGSTSTVTVPSVAAPPMTGPTCPIGSSTGQPQQLVGPFNQCTFNFIYR